MKAYHIAIAIKALELMAEHCRVQVEQFKDSQEPQAIKHCEVCKFWHQAATEALEELSEALESPAADTTKEE